MAKPVKKLVREIVEAALGQTVPERILQIVQGMQDTKTELAVLTDLMPYCYPKLSSVEATVSDDTQEQLRLKVDKLVDLLETE